MFKCLMNIFLCFGHRYTNIYYELWRYYLLQRKSKLYDIMKEDDTMAVSMAVVPLLTGKVASKIKDDFQNSQLRPYSDCERQKTNAAIAKILNKRRNEYRK